LTGTHRGILLYKHFTKIKMTKITKTRFNNPLKLATSSGKYTSKTRVVKIFTLKF